ncbi:malonate transporter [Mesorhizobium soli]|uniref:AEC family transporter n=1 Tax=Pseudaminobacter soli (ex Li et al. 2025) TaxID=1295366 RepID=UPI0024758500|nr:AEC family transporter [Mesorhizobium soli]MDH6229473.1 malonate transporter [Mesorhizobium soli]
MLAAFESILPIFLLILGGNWLRRLPLIDPGAWIGLEQIGYWFLYPALLFVTIYNADFSGLELNAMMMALAAALVAMLAITCGLWPLLDRTGLVKRTEFSSIFQTAVRWNSFMALAIAQKMFPPAGTAVVALVMAIIIIPLNLATVLLVTRFADRNANWRKIGRDMAINPMILGSLAAILFRCLPFHLYGPLNQTLGLVGNAALGMGLLAIGAGLRLGDLWRPRVALFLPVMLKLALFPALLVGAAVAFGITGSQLSYLALCAAVPTAMNGYLLARQLGGDAELYAAVTTVQTAASFLTIPAVLSLTAQITG